MKHATTILAGILCAGLAATALAQAPELAVIRAAVPPRIDGKLDDACWQGRPNVGDFKSTDPKHPLPAQKTEAWVAYDDDALYVAARCFEERMDMAAATATGHDAAIWHDDCLEVFLMPGEPYYYHFGANLLGAQYDSRNDTTPVAANGQSARWSAEWTSAAQRGQDGWTIEFAIPFACLQLGAQRLSAPLRINIGREEQRLIEFSCWPASEFHKVEEFAVLKGLNLNAKRYGLLLEDVTVGQRAPGLNHFKAMVAENATPDEPLDLRARVSAPPGGEPIVSSSRQPAAAGARLELMYSAPASGGAVGVAVECRDAQGKVRFAAADFFRTAAILEAALDMPMHYRSDAVVVLAGRLAVSETYLKGARLTAKLISGQETIQSQDGQIDPRNGAIHMVFPISKLKPGNYEIETLTRIAALSPEPIVQRFPLRVVLGPLE